MELERKVTKNDKKNFIKNWILFFKTYFSKPNVIGSIIPSSTRLSKLMASYIQNPSKDIIIELGAGTGVVTSQIINRGVDLDKFYSIEFDQNLYIYLKEVFVGFKNLFNIDAGEMTQHLPQNLIGKTDIIICTIPLLVIGKEKVKQIFHEAKKLLKKGAYFFQFTYSPFLPKYIKENNLQAIRCGFCCLNIPPAYVWRIAL